jgi:cell division protein FtsX
MQGAAEIHGRKRRSNRAVVAGLSLITVALLLAPLELAVLLVDPQLVSDDWWLWVGMTAALVVIAFPWVIGAVVHDVATDDPTPAQAYRQTADRVPDLAISALVTTIGITLGTLALVVPGLILVARWALVMRSRNSATDSARAARCSVSSATS